MVTFRQISPEAAERKLSDDPLEPIRHLFEIEIGMSRRKLALTASRPDVERGAGSRLLAQLLEEPTDDQGDESLSALARLDAEIAAVDNAIEQCRDRRRDMVKAVWAHQAAELKRRAGEIKAEAERHKATTADLLMRLQQHEGVPFGPAQPSPGNMLLINGAWRPEQPTYRPATKSNMMLAEAAALDGQAQALESRQPISAGSITAESVDDLETQIEAWEVMQIACRLDHAIEWATPAVERAQERIANIREHQDGFGSTISIELYWSAAGLDTKNSKVSIVDPPLPRELVLSPSWPGH